MNLGAGETQYDIIAFLHCDTLLPTNAGDLILHALSKEKVWGRFDVQLDKVEWPYRLIGTMINLRSRTRNLATGDQVIFVRRDAFNQVGGFPDIRIMEDIAISKQLSALSKPALIDTPVITSARRWATGGITKTILLMWKMRFMFWVGISPNRLKEMYSDAR